jgi:hypothetical protein
MHIEVDNKLTTITISKDSSYDELEEFMSKNKRFDNLVIICEAGGVMPDRIFKGVVAINFTFDVWIDGTVDAQKLEDLEMTWRWFEMCTIEFRSAKLYGCISQYKLPSRRICCKWEMREQQIDKDGYANPSFTYSIDFRKKVLTYEALANFEKRTLKWELTMLSRVMPQELVREVFEYM